jgi:hypothetical protein
MERARASERARDTCSLKQTELFFPPSGRTPPGQPLQVTGPFASSRNRVAPRQFAPIERFRCLRGTLVDVAPDYLETRTAGTDAEQAAA